MRHPLDFLPSDKRKPLFLSLLALTLILFAVFRALDAPLRTPAAPNGIVSYELAGDIKPGGDTRLAGGARVEAGGVPGEPGPGPLGVRVEQHRAHPLDERAGELAPARQPLPQLGRVRLHAARDRGGDGPAVPGDRAPRLPRGGRGPAARCAGRTVPGPRRRPPPRSGAPGTLPAGTGSCPGACP